MHRWYSFLDVLELEGEARADLLERCSFGRLERVPVTSEEEEVPLIMQGDDLSAFEFGHGREEGLEHSADHVSESSHEPVEDEFGVVRAGSSVSLKAKDVSYPMG